MLTTTKLNDAYFFSTTVTDNLRTDFTAINVGGTNLYIVAIGNQLPQEARGLILHPAQLDAACRHFLLPRTCFAPTETDAYLSCIVFPCLALY